LRWIYLTIAGVSCALGLLTAIRAPDWVDWRLTILACGFGYVAAVLPAAVMLAVALSPANKAAVAIATQVLAGIACVLLLQPCVQAWLMGRDLPARLRRSFGDARVAGQPFTLGGLVAGWPKEAPMRTLVYHEGLKLDFYPAIGRVNAPCVIVIHGGGWDSGDRGQIATFNSWLARGGYAAADISYRLAPEAVWPAQRDDVAASIAYVKGHAAELGVDPTRIVLFGRSAGGQIAEACAYGLKDPSIRGVIAFYAPADMNFAWKWGREDDALNSPRLLRRFLGGDPGTAGPPMTARAESGS
jgi:acetyl esterase/lipase